MLPLTAAAVVVSLMLAAAARVTAIPPQWNEPSAHARNAEDTVQTSPIEKLLNGSERLSGLGEPIR